jgi:hypothetical protein
VHDITTGVETICTLTNLSSHNKASTINTSFLPRLPDYV